jgi:hypothetical protein
VTEPQIGASPAVAVEGRSSLGLLVRVLQPAVIGAVWFVAVLTAVLWVWGVNPLVFPSPDEALNRLAASVIADHGKPFLHLPFPDPEDLAHPRFWVTLGDHAVPAYAPVALYVYALLIKIPLIGMLLVATMPATGAGAFAAGTARLLPPTRRWLALLAPAMGFPALYWLLRPWVNMSPLLICLSWALFAWASFRESGSRRWLAAAMSFVGAAAAVRPDYAAYTLLPALLFTLGAKPAEWRRIVLFAVAAGAAAVALNLALNQVITGNPLRAAYQLLIDRQGEGGSPGGATVFRLPGMLGPLLLPMGLAPLSVLRGVFVKYWVDMGPIKLLLFGQLAIVPLLVAAPRRQRLLNAAGIVVVLCFIASRMADDVYGAKLTQGLVHHSTPRYFAPAYLFAALPPLLLLGRTSSRIVLFLGSVLACAAAALGAYEVYGREGTSLVPLRAHARTDARLLAKLHTKIPSGAVVYTDTRDKVLWSGWHVCTMGATEPTAASMERALAAGLRVYVMEPGFSPSYGALARRLRAKDLAFNKIDVGQGLYRLQRKPAPPAAVAP